MTRYFDALIINDFLPIQCQIHEVSKTIIENNTGRFDRLAARKSIKCYYYFSFCYLFILYFFLEVKSTIVYSMRKL